MESDEFEQFSDSSCCSLYIGFPMYLLLSKLDAIDRIDDDLALLRQPILRVPKFETIRISDSRAYPSMSADDNSLEEDLQKKIEEWYSVILEFLIHLSHSERITSFHVV